MIDLNITVTEEVAIHTAKSLTIRVRGAYMDFKDYAMYVVADYLDDAGTVHKTRQICVRGDFYTLQNSTLADAVLGAIQAGATAILSNPSPAQEAIDAGDVVIKDVQTNYHTTTIVMETQPMPEVPSMP